jgi:hypothetical protein
MTYARRGKKRRSDSLALWRHDEASGSIRFDSQV